MVLIHGIGSTWRVWKPVLEPLEARHEVLALSLPGYGESPPLDREPTVPALVDAVEQEMDEAGFETAHIVGNSLGGWITAELAARGRARTAVAIDAAGLWTRKELAFSSLSLDNTIVATRRIAPFAHVLARFAPLRQLMFLQVQTRAWRNDPEETAYAIRAMANSPSFMQTKDWIVRNHAMPVGLDAIHCPFLVLWGSWDCLLPPRQAARWQRIVPGAELRVLPRLGHVPMADDPDLVAGILLDFAARPSGRKPAKRSPERPAAAQV
jgi:pimeloyl-ACP methyl ester carboxylesterase